MAAIGWSCFRRRHAGKQENEEAPRPVETTEVASSPQQVKVPISRFNSTAGWRGKSLPKRPEKSTDSDTSASMENIPEVKHSRLPRLSKFELPKIPVGGMLSGLPTAVTSQPDDRPLLPELDDGRSPVTQPDYGWPPQQHADAVPSPPTHIAEMDSNQQPYEYIDRKESGSDILPIQKPPPLSDEDLPETPLASGPETQVSIHPGPVPRMSSMTTTSVPTSEEELLAAQHAQLVEQRRRIEREQAAIEEKMAALQGSTSSIMSKKERSMLDV